MPLRKAQLDLFGSSGFCFTQNISINFCGDVHISVSKMLRYNFQVYTAVEQKRSVTVPELIKSHILELRSFGEAFEGLID